jgi:YVTN family beta-propeller protein
MSPQKLVPAFLLALFSLSGMFAQSTVRTSVPLPDDDSLPASATEPSKIPQAKKLQPKAVAPAKPTLEPKVPVTGDDWNAEWKDSAKISGIRVDFRIIPSLKDVIVKRGSVPVSLSQLNETAPVEGEQAIMQFRFTDPAGTPLSGLNVAAWLDKSLNEKNADEASCHSKIQSFLQMQFAARPEVDLNTYYVLALTKEPGILVIDPRVGFSSSRLYAAVDLPAPGEDWALTGDHDRLFVSMPSINKVAVIDTLTFRVQATIDAGASPHRIVLQPDGKFLWIANDSSDTSISGVTVVDAGTLKVVAHISTGSGHHKIVFDEARHVYVSNQDAASVSVINAEKLARIKDLSVGQAPVSLAYSARSKAVYVASQASGAINVISTEDQNLIATILGRPGLNVVRITPDGRWGFAANTVENTVLLFDVSSNKVKQVYSVGTSPDQLSFTTAYAYVRSRASENVTLIPLSDVGKTDGTAHFVAGQSAPGDSAAVLADAIAPALDSASAFIANAADRRIYFYQEGMAAPMFSMEGYGKTPKSAMVLDRSIHETSPGIYSIGVKLPSAAPYDVPIFVDSPSISHCFKVEVENNPLLKKVAQVPVALHPLKNDLQVHPGVPVQVSFRLLDAASEKPRDGLKDVEITVLLAEGLRQQHFSAEAAGEGVYSFTFTPEKAGVYYAMVQIPSLKIKPNQLPYMMVHAVSQPQSSSATVPAPQQHDQNNKQ